MQEVEKIQDQTSSDESLDIAQAGEKKWYKCVMQWLSEKLSEKLNPHICFLFPHYDGSAVSRREYVVNALGFLVIGITVGYAPQYIQTNDHSFTGISRLASLLLLAIGMYRLHRIYPRVFNLMWIPLLMMPFATIFLYLDSELWLPPRVNVSATMNIRVGSFIFLIGTILEILALISYLVDLYQKRKERIKPIFSVKSILGVILGVLTMGTALFQFLQVLLSFFHH